MGARLPTAFGRDGWPNLRVKRRAPPPYPSVRGAQMLSCESRAPLCKLRRVAPAVGLAVPEPSLRQG